MASPTPLPALKRFITTHNTEGKAIFSNEIPEDNALVKIDDSVSFALTYACEGLPVDLNKDSDIKTYQHYLTNTPSLAIGNGTIVRHVDFAPNIKHVMHRTISLDYGVVLEGEIECVLDSGERRKLKRGDVCVQRGTNHAWENLSNEWCRMMFVLQTSRPVEIEGKGLVEDLGSMKDKL